MKNTAILLIDTYPQRDHTVTELARAAGLSVRTLERQFRRRLGLTPHAYLRHVRFERVRSELMAPASEKKRVRFMSDIVFPFLVSTGVQAPLP